MRIIAFKKNDPDWGTQLRGKIGSALKEVLARPAEAVLPAFLDIADAGAKLSVTAQEKQIAELARDVDALRAEVRSTARLPYDGIGHLLDEAREMFSTDFSKSDVIADLKRRYGVSDAKAMEVALYAAHLAGRTEER